MSAKLSILFASINGAIIVILGAFGAHALSNVLSVERMATLHTGIKYHMFHTLSLIGVSLLSLRFSTRSLQGASVFFAVGILLFCGSLYALAFGAPRLLGMLTPVGGMCFIVGWLCLFYFSFTVDIHENRI